jgi:hypothetical protein
VIIEQPEWLPKGQENIGAALNRAATDWASGKLLSVTIFAETTDDGMMVWATEPEDLVRLIGFLTAFSNYVSHSVPFDSGEDDEEEGEQV